MKLQIDHRDLVRALGSITSVVEQRVTMPILSHILLKAEKDQVVLTATDMEMEVAITLAAKIEKAGEGTLPARKLHDIIRKLPPGEITLESKDDSCAVRSGRAKFDLRMLAPTDFPQLSATNMPCSFTLSAEHTRTLLGRTTFAMSQDDSRYYLGGLSVQKRSEKESGVLQVAATDGHRLAVTRLAYQEKGEPLPNIIIPRKTVTLLSHLLEGNDEDVQISAGEGSIQFVLAGATMTSKLIDGQYPDYERVIPNDNDQQATINREEFVHIIDRVATVVSDQSRAIKIALAEKTMIVSASDEEQNHGIEETSLDYAGQNLEIGFNARYILDVAKAVQADDMVLRFKDPTSPCLILDPGDDQTQYVVMPLRI
ncbi:MAG: DNA polymerase III subunit beta [Pseudomonadota bacterium]